MRKTGGASDDTWPVKLGYSPDGLVGEDGLIEIKSRRQKKHLQTIINDAVPPENMAQLQCGLLVSGREWIDYVSFCGGMPLYVKRVTPDEQWQDAILTAVEAFEEQVVPIVTDFERLTWGMHPTDIREFITNNKEGGTHADADTRNPSREADTESLRVCS